MLSYLRSLGGAAACAALALAFTAAPGDAGLINTPAPGASSPSLLGGSANPGTGMAGDQNRPLPPVLLNSNTSDGWSIGIGQENAGGRLKCGQPANVVARVVPGRNTTWAYHFTYDGATSVTYGTVDVPAAPNIPGTKLGGKNLYFTPPSKVGVVRVWVVENGHTLSSAPVSVLCT